MTAPITPDERAAMRERAERLHHYGGESQAASEDIIAALDALDTAEAEVARLREEAARPAPVPDDSDALTLLDEMNHDGRIEYSDYSALHDAITAARPAVVREHLPVRPDREAVALALCKEQDSIEHMEQTDDAPCSRCLAWADAVLLEWPGESRATVQAEALRDAAAAVTEIDGRRDDAAARWLRARADRLEKGETR